MSIRRDLGLVLVGTGLGQLIPILASPVLTRLYTPAQMGDFALFGSLVGILVILSTGRFELSIILPKRDQDALALVALCTLTALAVNVVVSISTITLTVFSPSSTSIWTWLPWLGPTALVTAWFQTLYFWSNRGRHFRHMSEARIARAASIAAFQLSFSRLGSNGLILGLLVGVAVGFVRLVFVCPLKRLARRFRQRRTIIAQAYRYRDFPRFSMWASLAENLGANLPVFLLTGLFSPAEAGLFALAQRVIRVPIQVVSTAMGDVFRERAARQYQEAGTCRGLLVRTIALQAGLALVPALLLLLTAGDAVSFLFGSEWRPSGDIIRVLVPMFFLQFLANPIGNMFIIAEKQHIGALMQACLVLGSAAALWVGAVYGRDPITAVLLYGLVYSAKYGVELSLAYRWSVQGSAAGP